jgi:hypothetical protein
MPKIYKKKDKSPQLQVKPKIEIQEKERASKHTMDNIYSITIRCGNGLNLGKKAVQKIESYFEKTFAWYILSVEKKGDESHFQGGGFSLPSIRQDNILRAIRPYVLELWEEQELDKGHLISEKQKALVSKHAIKVIPHTSFEKLVTYCSKEGFFAVHKYRLDTDLTEYLRTRIYCKDHGNPLSIYHSDTSTDDDYMSSCYKCMPLPQYFIRNIEKQEEYNYNKIN